METQTDTIIATPPTGVNRSGIACWFSIINLVTRCNALGVPCYLWTLTFPKTYNDAWCGQMHSRLVRYLNKDAKRHPQYFSHGFGAVRVCEVHPDGHGLHYHWVIRGRIQLSYFRHRARQCGFGHIFIARHANKRFRRVDAGVAAYLAKYLLKADKVTGIRSWACLGDYVGTKTRDVEFDSRKNRVFRQAYANAKTAGGTRPQCYSAAVIEARNWEHNHDDRDEKTSLTSAVNWPY